MAPKRFIKKSFNLEKTITKGTKYLVIVESPSKCKKIEQYLGVEYACISSVGHLRNISGLKSIDKKDNFKITYDILQDKSSHIESMQKIMKKFKKENIILATDDDREGEAIAWHICQIFELDPTTCKRILFNEITETALKRAIQTPTTINMQLVYAQQSRQVIDILVGFKVSPVLWKYLYNSKTNSLSAGRCQTPALRLVYEKDLEIQKSCPEKTYKTVAAFFAKELEFTLSKCYETQEEVSDFLKESADFGYTLTLCPAKDSIRSPPKPFNTSNLLQSASSLLHISPKETMSLCQKLYQDGLITYMRTDSTKYSKTFIDDVKEYIVKTFKSDTYLGDIDSLEIKSNVLPHEAIRVTYILKNELAGEENKRLASLYKLIWRNTIESCMSHAKYKITECRISAPQNNYYSRNVEVPIFLGFKKLTEKIVETDEQNEGSGLLLYMQALPKKEIRYRWIESAVTIKNKVSHYCEASLIKKLEDLGIGRPSTFASIVETIQDRGYVKRVDIEGTLLSIEEYRLTEGAKIPTVLKKEKVFGQEKSKLMIQPLGILTVTFLLEYFASLFSYDYTKSMELELDLVGEGTIVYEDVCKKFSLEISKCMKSVTQLKKQAFKVEEYELVYSNYGPVLRYTDIDSNSYRYKNIKKDIKLDLEKLKRCEYTVADLIDPIQNDSLGEYEGFPLILKSGKYGAYLEWGTNRKGLKDFADIKSITLEKAIQFLESNELPNLESLDIDVTNKISENDSIGEPTERETTERETTKRETTEREPTKEEQPTNPVSLTIMRVLREDLSIRKGKYGAYIFYKTSSMCKPTFYKLKGFPYSYTMCEKDTLIKWINETYKI